MQGESPEGYDAVGTVDFFNDTGRYGFIESRDVDEDVFFHMEDIDGTDLVEGTEVAFDVEEAEKGPRARRVLRDPDLSESDAGDERSGTEVYDSGTEDVSSGTEVYGSDTGEDETEVYVEVTYCPHCGTHVGAYEQPIFCPDCGRSLRATL